MDRRTKLLLGGLALLGGGLVLFAPYAWSQHHLRAAERALHRYDFGAARDHLEQSLRTWPGNARALFLAARTARQLDHCGEAERRLAEYERRQGVTEESRLEWLLLGVQQGDLGGHVRELQSLVDAEHRDAPLILEALAKGFMNASRGSDMLTCLNTLLKREPNNVAAPVLRAKGRDGLHDLEGALEDYDRAVEVNPASSDSRLLLADIFQRLGRVREAIAYYELLRQQQSGNPAILLGLARCQFDSSELAQAEELLDTVLAAQPDHVTALLERGRLAFCRGEMAAAEEHLSRAAALAPWHRPAHQLLARCLQAQDKGNEAEKCRLRLQELERSDSQLGRLSLRFRSTPRDASVRFDLAMWAMQNGREPDGLRWLFATLLVDPRHGPTHAALADHLERTGQPRRSAEHRRLAAGG